MAGPGTCKEGPALLDFCPGRVGPGHPAGQVVRQRPGPAGGSFGAAGLVSAEDGTNWVALPFPQVDIVVLGERTLFVLSESGQIRFQRRLDFLPTAVLPYFLDHSAARQNLLIGSSTGNLVVVDVNKACTPAAAAHDRLPS